MDNVDIFQRNKLFVRTLKRHPSRWTGTAPDLRGDNAMCGQILALSKRCREHLTGYLQLTMTKKNSGN